MALNNRTYIQYGDLPAMWLAHTFIGVVFDVAKIQLIQFVKKAVDLATPIFGFSGSVMHGDGILSCTTCPTALLKLNYRVACNPPSC